MGLQLTQIIDPRDKLEKVRRKPLERFIRAHYPHLYVHNTPANVMRQLLRQINVLDIDAPVHTLGKTEEEPRNAVDADALMMAEWQAKQKLAEQDGETRLDMAELRKAVKARGIKAPRTSKRADLERMLNGKDTS